MCYAHEIQLAFNEMQIALREMFPLGTLLLKTFGFLSLSFCNNGFFTLYGLGLDIVLTGMGYI